MTALRLTVFRLSDRTLGVLGAVAMAAFLVSVMVWGGDAIALLRDAGVLPEVTLPSEMI